MVSFEEIIEEKTTATDVTAMETDNNNEGDNSSSSTKELASWEERLLDAKEIEQVAQTLKRPTARMQLESLAKRIRKESDALKRVEMMSKTNDDEKKEDNNNNNITSEQQNDENIVPSPPPSSPPATAHVTTKTPPPTPAVSAASSFAATSSSLIKYIPIDRFAFDAGGYNAPFVTLYIDLPGIGSIPRENIICNYTKDSFDFIVKNLKDEKSYRLYKDNLEKDINPEKCKIIIKSDKVIIKLAKVKQSDYGGYDYWSKLTDPKKKNKGNTDNNNPQASIMNLMKEMYEDGDDNMKKIIGETMMKQQRGELDGKNNDPMKDLDDMGDF